MFKIPEQYRAPHPMGFPHDKGDPFGWFLIRRDGVLFAVMFDAQTDWEHVSVSIPGKSRCPTWPEMCMIKDLFWEPEARVVQYHPPKSEYVNVAKNCLHLWRYKGEMPHPPKNYVG